MSDRLETFDQSDIVRLSDEDAAVALLEHAVTGLWEVVNELMGSKVKETITEEHWLH